MCYLDIFRDKYPRVPRLCHMVDLFFTSENPPTDCHSGWTHLLYQSSLWSAPPPAFAAVCFCNDGHFDLDEMGSQHSIIFSASIVFLCVHWHVHHSMHAEIKLAGVTQVEESVLCFHNTGPEA